MANTEDLLCATCGFELELLDQMPAYRNPLGTTARFEARCQNPDCCMANVEIYVSILPDIGAAEKYRR